MPSPEPRTDVAPQSISGRISGRTVALALCLIIASVLAFNWYRAYQRGRDPSASGVANADTDARLQP